MRYKQKEAVPPSPPKFDAGFDCELPPNARTELGAPRRPRTLGHWRPASLEPGAQRRLILLAIVALMTIAGAIAYWSQQKTAAKAVSAQPELTPAPLLVAQLWSAPRVCPYKAASFSLSACPVQRAALIGRHVALDR